MIDADASAGRGAGGDSIEEVWLSQGGSWLSRLDTRDYPVGLEQLVRLLSPGDGPFFITLGDK
jgi:hypothetical protein